LPPTLNWIWEIIFHNHLNPRSIRITFGGIGCIHAETNKSE